MGRSSEKPHPRKDQQYRAKEQLELVHVDIAGSFIPKSVDKKGYQHNLVVVDDFSKKSWCIPLRKKSDTKVGLKEWIVVAENQTGKRLKKLRSDNEKGEVEKFKARVVAKGFNQVEGVDYDQTFSPTVRFEGIRQMVALGTSRGMNMHQMDVTTTFLNAPLEEEVYMEQPEGTIEEGDEGNVMRLLKCLYGLKQSPRQWNILIDTVLKNLGFKRLLFDVGMYVKGEGVDAVYIALYVDDLFIVGMKLINIESVKKGLCEGPRGGSILAWDRDQEAREW